MRKWIKCLLSFWLWIAVVLASFMMAAVSAAASSVPKAAVVVFAAVIFTLALASVVVNPGIFAKQISSATGS